MFFVALFFLVPVIVSLLIIPIGYVSFIVLVIASSAQPPFLSYFHNPSSDDSPNVPFRIVLQGILKIHTL
jgi:hypothetical protein